MYHCLCEIVITLLKKANICLHVYVWLWQIYLVFSYFKFIMFERCFFFLVKSKICIKSSYIFFLIRYHNLFLMLTVHLFVCSKEKWALSCYIGIFFKEFLKWINRLMKMKKRENQNPLVIETKMIKIHCPATQELIGQIIKMAP